MSHATQLDQDVRGEAWLLSSPSATRLRVNATLEKAGTASRIEAPEHNLKQSLMTILLDRARVKIWEQQADPDARCIRNVMPRLAQELFWEFFHRLRLTNKYASRSLLLK